MGTCCSNFQQQLEKAKEIISLLSEPTLQAKVSRAIICLTPSTYTLIDYL